MVLNVDRVFDVEMERMDEDTRRIIEGLVDDLKSRESVVGIGLFGSWSRGEAVQGSDVDLLVVDSRNLDYEYVERAEIDDTFLDLNYIPCLLYTSPSPRDRG